MRSSSFPGRDPDHAQDLRNNSKDDSAPCRSASVVIPKYRSEPVRCPFATLIMPLCCWCDKSHMNQIAGNTVGAV